MVLLNNVDWQRFCDRLALALSQIPPQSVLIFSDTGNRFAQFAMAESDLLCEVVSNAYLEDDHLMSSAAEATMAEHGWERISQDRNWSRQLRWPARLAEYQLIAGCTVAALRDVLGIGDPGELETELRSLDGNIDKDPLRLTT